MRVRFGPFTLDLDTRQLTRRHREIHLEPKAFELLAALIAGRPRVLTKSVLQRHLWPHTFVEEANLSNLIAGIRDVLGDRARAPKFIRTVHGVGYAFCGEATRETGVAARDSGRPSCWLESGRRRFPLSEGEHVIGRDPDADVRLDASTVSRRHARIAVTADETRLEDAGSKNGTFHGDARLTRPVVLTDGDAFRIGSVLVTFHVRTRSMTADTRTVSRS